MTIADWLTDREADAPPELLDAAREALGRDAARPAAEAAPVLLDAAERELATWLNDDAGGRAGAVPLLTIDALVTLALEAAADAPAGIDAVAADTMVRLSALAESRERRHADPDQPISDSQPHERSR